MSQALVTPAPLLPGDTIAIIAPATIVNPQYIDRAAETLTALGYQVRVMPHAKGPSHGTYAANLSGRTADLVDAWTDPDIKAILCARGGYGAIHLLPRFTEVIPTVTSKWLLGFSDISALHAALYSAGVRSLHAPMAKHISELGVQNPTIKMTLDILAGHTTQTISAPPSELNITGHAQGLIRGGNLAVLNSLADTPYDILHVGHDEDVILFIEDVSEKVYAVERMLTRLILGGNIQRLKALLVGQFTDYPEDRNHGTVERMIHSLLLQYDIEIPVAFNVPIGHVEGNYPIIEGADAMVDITTHGTLITTA